VPVAATLKVTEGVPSQTVCEDGCVLMVSDWLTVKLASLDWTEPQGDVPLTITYYVPLSVIAALLIFNVAEVAPLIVPPLERGLPLKYH
jgi:hypothetical protein